MSPFWIGTLVVNVFSVCAVATCSALSATRIQLAPSGR